MTTSVQAAVDTIATALKAVDWIAECECKAYVDSSPERVWTEAEQEEFRIVHVIGGGRAFDVLQRSAVIVPRPSVAICFLHYIAPDEAGLVDAVELEKCEAVTDKAIAAARDAIVSSNRFAILGIEQPARYDQTLLTQGRFVTVAVFELKDRAAL